MRFVRRIVIDAPAERVWAVLAHEFAGISVWASGVSHSAPTAIAADGPAESGRVCQTSVGEVRETIIRFDEAGRSMSYRADGLPGFVAEAVNNCSVIAQGPNRSVVAMRADFRPKGILGVIMVPLLKFQMGRLMREATEELRHYVETGQPHPRKQRANATTTREASAR
jgi:hypothetical protein